MIKVENIEVWGFEHAVRGMRNPMNSWDKSDSYQSDFTDDGKNGFVIGKNDLDLMRRLYKAGSEHRKYLRQIFISMDITAPLYWWKEADQYKIGTVTNSCSTMHKVAAKEFELDDFSYEHLNNPSLKVFNSIIACMNDYREKYLACRCKSDWWQLIQLLPTSYNQKRTITMNYENVISMLHQREGHKLDEWNILLGEFKEKLPYIKEITEI